MCGKGGRGPGDVGNLAQGYDQAEAMLDVDVISGVAGNVRVAIVNWPLRQLIGSYTPPPSPPLCTNIGILYIHM